VQGTAEKLVHTQTCMQTSSHLAFVDCASLRGIWVRMQEPTPASSAEKVAGPMGTSLPCMKRTTGTWLLGEPHLRAAVKGMHGM
jgi:hypothetical protein